MADQKKWFKVWGSILIDPDHRDMSLEDVGRWTRLGAYLVTAGERGKIKIIPPATSFISAMNVPDIETLLVALKRLPNVHIMLCQDANGSFIVTMKNWYKYQVDYTSGERVKRIRHKRRGEVEEKLTSTPTSTPTLRASRLGGAVATRETSTSTSGGDNGTVRSKSIDQQAFERKQDLRLGKIRSVVANPTEDVGKILDRFGVVPKIPPET